MGLAIRADTRDTTVYASATLPLGDIEPLTGVHMAETYMGGGG